MYLSLSFSNVFKIELLRHPEFVGYLLAQRIHIAACLFWRISIRAAAICLCSDILLTVSNGTPCESVTAVENVCRASWIVGLNDSPA